MVTRYLAPSRFASIRNNDSKMQDDVLTVKKTFALGLYLDLTYKDPLRIECW
jgi:hypothetical protein